MNEALIQHHERCAKCRDKERDEQLLCYAQTEADYADYECELRRDDNEAIQTD